ncbi:hypothetical protein FOZ61_001290, partial [Perkinsus olseni]
VCKRWSSVLRSDWLWKGHCEARGFHHSTESTPKTKRNCHSEGHRSTAVWRDIYRKRHSVEKRFGRGQYVERKRDSRSAPILDLKTFSASALAACRSGRLLVYDLSGSAEPLGGEWWTTVTKPKMELVRPLRTGEPFSVKPVAAFTCAPLSEGYVGAGYAGNGDGSITVWRLGTREGVANWMGHRGGATTSICHVEGSKLASAGSDGYCCVWDPSAAAKCVWSSPPPAWEGEDPSMRIRKQFTSVSRVDAAVIIAGRKDSSWRAYDTRVGGRHTEVAKYDMNDWCMCVEADGQGSHTVRASDKSVKIFDIRRVGSERGEPLQERHQSSRLLTRFCSDGRYRLVTCGLDGRVLVSSLENDSKQVSEVHSED